MPSETFLQLLGRAAAVCGIEPEFWDIWGRHHVTTPEAQQVILRAKGLDADNAESLDRSLSALVRREWERLLPPVLVTGASAHLELPLSVPADSLGEMARFSVRREDGAESWYELSLASLPETEPIDLDGHRWVRKQVRIPLELPLGYHDVSLSLGAFRANTRYIVTPERAYMDSQAAGRAAGIAVSLYGVRSGRNWGCGDFTDLRAIIDWVADEMNAGFVALNPLHAIHNRRPFNTSPYLPNCIFYQNFLYLDVEHMDDFSRSPRALKLRQSPDVINEIEELRRSPSVEYERVAALKLRFLKRLYLQFLREWNDDSPRAAEFEAFRKREGDLLERFATYCALDEHLHQCDPNLWHWKQWPAAYQDPNSPETAAFRQKHWRRVMFYQYLQWQIDIQLSDAQRWARERRLPIGLYHDLALATDSFGSDLWAHRPFFIAGSRVGSPPDDFAPKGQDWGFPPPNAERHREDGYRLFAESIRKNCRHGGALRIDHVMRLFRLYWIPEGSDATQGAYVRERSSELVRILALESVRNRVIVVGEDLGTVEPEIRETLARFGILSYRLFYFEKNPNGEFRKDNEYPQQAVVSSTTHDLPTLAGFWTAADIETRRSVGMLDDQGFRAQSSVREQEKQKMLDLLFQLGLMPAHLPRFAAAYPELTGELHNAIIGFLARTPSQLLAINQEDLTKERFQQNLPGTTWQYPNWGRKMRFTVEQLRSAPEARGYTAMLRNWIVNSGRGNHTGHASGADSQRLQ
ncbi:MAG TPA: 4-alpha-glucanotransferase [Bryobacteraceae bacterium]|nr:4-alpha-glucanotransferase [Bryobacteraceae bacterium]